MPAPKAEPGGVRLLTWNILHGQEHGPPWRQNNWPARKQGLGEVLRQALPDILFVQEARAGQLTFLDATLPRHRRIGVGRDDGQSGGEHCAPSTSTVVASSSSMAAPFGWRSPWTGRLARGRA